MRTSRALNKTSIRIVLFIARLGFIVALATLTAYSFLIKAGGRPEQNKITAQNNYYETKILIGAGDIALCGAQGPKQTARLLEASPGVIFTAGDNAQRTATLDFYNKCFGESWGKYLPRIRPALGNHDYETPGAKGYFDYFGANAGEKGQGYYSYNIKTWHIVVLNSNCDQVGGCAEDSPQGRWLKADLAANPALCTLAYWHHPYFNSGNHSTSVEVKPFWDILYRAGAEIIMNGHAHDYERFAPQTPEGERDDEKGIREFIVGTGGYAYNSFGATVNNSEVKNTGVFGVLKLELKSREYSWQFIPVEGGKFTDSGSGQCH